MSIKVVASGKQPAAPALAWRCVRSRAAAAAAASRAPGLRVVALQAGKADHAVRVRGDAQRVSWFCSDLASWPTWSPLTKKAAKLGLADATIRPGSKFELSQELWGVMKYPMMYEVVEYQPGKRLVLSGVSEYHMQMDSFLFMPDRHDQRMTVVRYVSDARLRHWRSALQPVMAKMLACVPEESLSSLQKLLNGPRSPLLTEEFQEAWQRQARASVDAKKGRPSTGGRQPPKKASSGGWGLFGALGARGAGEGSAADEPEAVDAAPLSDPAGHFAVLGLAAAVSPSDAEVRAAYRQLAAQWHPDRQRGKSAAEQQRAVAQFSRVMRAYEVLRDPTTRRLYESGQYLEASVDL